MTMEVDGLTDGMPEPRGSRVIAVANQKGGVGKRQQLSILQPHWPRSVAESSLLIWIRRGTQVLDLASIERGGR